MAAGRGAAERSARSSRIRKTPYSIPSANRPSLLQQQSQFQQQQLKSQMVIYICHSFLITTIYIYIC